MRVIAQSPINPFMRVIAQSLALWANFLAAALLIAASSWKFEPYFSTRIFSHSMR
jgi:purine nucleoside permease